MALNWPPLAAPIWSPMEIGMYQASDWTTLLREFQEIGFTRPVASVAERIEFFDLARCGEGHTLTGRMLLSPSGVRYPFAVCDEPSHRELLVLWPPFTCGSLTG